MIITDFRKSSIIFCSIIFSSSTCVSPSSVRSTLVRFVHACNFSGRPISTVVGDNWSFVDLLWDDPWAHSADSTSLSALFRALKFGIHPAVNNQIPIQKFIFRKTLTKCPPFPVADSQMAILPDFLEKQLTQTVLFCNNWMEKFLRIIYFSKYMFVILMINLNHQILISWRFNFSLTNWSWITSLSDYIVFCGLSTLAKVLVFL